MTNSSSKNNSDNSDTVADSGTQSGPPRPSANAQLSARDRVMLEFQRTTLQMTLNMMHAQQEVLLAYLNGSGGGAAGNGQYDPAQSVGNESLSRTIQNVVQSQQQFLNAQQLELIPTAQPQQQYAAHEPIDLTAVPAVTSPERRASEALAVQTAPSAEPQSGSGIDVEFLVSSLVDIVSERTGYPPDMLDPQLDLEADLGIDSIKRVEILNSFRKLLPEEKQQALEASIEQLAAIKSLDGIMHWIRTELPTIGSPPTGAAGSGTRQEQPIVARGARLHGAIVTQIEPGIVHFGLNLNTKTDLYLNDHTFDGVPVMPMAMATELMLEAAASCHEGSSVVSISDMEIPAGIVFETGSKDLIITAQSEKVNQSKILVKTSVMTSGALKRTHFKAVVELTPGAVAPPAAVGNLPPSFQPREYRESASVPTAAQVYDEIMFHGKLFQGISSVTALGMEGITGELTPTPMKDLLSFRPTEDWLLDPILLDSAMQMAGVWGRHHLQITLLPNGFERIRWVPTAGIKKFKVMVAAPADTTGLELRCDLTVYSDSGELVLVVEGLKGIGSKSLNRLAAKKVQQGKGS